ncbi:hypothetical protein [Halalkalicoccus ordinarius]|uniref:hypothetical protein n=1 Tax=Halalkalicoccus ordinarius TaxID=3116651 RepID=UPI00300EDC66
MFGVVTRNAEECSWPEFDLAFYEYKQVSGRATEPIPDAINMISCFGDNAAAESSPELVPVNEAGERATRERPYFDWAYVCPTHEGYREGLLEMVSEAAEANEDVRLDDVGFPRQGYCFCERCNRLFDESEFEDRLEWRASVITEFVAEAADRIPGRTYLTLYPDPYPGHLYERAGLSIDELEEHVDEFVIPLYDMAYSTTYWLETIASGFESALSRPFSIELYTVDVDVDKLIHATEVADAYAKDVLFGYDAAQAQAMLRRMRADTREGRSYGPDS